MIIFVLNPCKQEKRALERKLSEMEEEMKVGNTPFTLPILGFFALSFGIITPELDIKGVHGKCVPLCNQKLL